MPKAVDSFTFQFRKRRYKIVRTHSMPADFNGYCHHPESQGKEIRIRPNLRGRTLLETAIDEAIHACLWDLDNDSVDEIATSIAAFLWKLGFREQHGCQKRKASSSKRPNRSASAGAGRGTKSRATKKRSASTARPND